LTSYDATRLLGLESCMPKATLRSLTIERFKGYWDKATLEIAPLTILLGRNNSGKSSLIQVLLFLKQTLANSRGNAPLFLEGPLIDALGLQELTSGWPDGDVLDGPELSLIWDSIVDVEEILLSERYKPEMNNLAKHSGISWLEEEVNQVHLKTEFSISFSQISGNIIVRDANLRSWRYGENSEPSENPSAHFQRDNESNTYLFKWKSDNASQILVEFDRFLPVISIDRGRIGPRHRQRSFLNGYKILYEQPLEDLRKLLLEFNYLGSSRNIPHSIYRPTVNPPEEIGVSGEYAVQLLHSRQTEFVHYLPPSAINVESTEMPDLILAKPLAEAVNDVIKGLGINVDISLREIENFGFQFLVGSASLQHVGRGLGYLLPVVVLGLIADPICFNEPDHDVGLQNYVNACVSIRHAGLEEPEAHLHPKVQTLLAHWFVALAMAGRRIIVETHSDHLVRRLRGLVARTQPGSPLEKWLTESIVIGETVQASNGHSSLSCSTLTSTGKITERWPADFMDEAANEEREIYYAGLDKNDIQNDLPEDTYFIHDPSEVLEAEQ